jgi:hypothetical protein
LEAAYENLRDELADEILSNGQYTLVLSYTLLANIQNPDSVVIGVTKPHNVFRAYNAIVGLSEC